MDDDRADIERALGAFGLVLALCLLALIAGCGSLEVTIDPVPGGEVARVRCEGAAVEISSPATLTVREVE